MFVNMTAAAVGRVAGRQNVRQLEILPVVGGNCCQGVNSTVWARLALGCRNDSVFFFDDLILFQQFLGLVWCPCACGRGRCNDNKNNHVVGSLVIYQRVVQWCCCTTPAYDCKVKVACQVIVLSGLL